MPSAHTSTLKPAGTLSLSSGRSFDGRPVRCGANGCNVDSAIAAGLPCCQEGGGRLVLGQRRNRKRGGNGKRNGALHIWSPLGNEDATTLPAELEPQVRLQ